jgi:hypothetical protein
MIGQTEVGVGAGQDFQSGNGTDGSQQPDNNQMYPFDFPEDDEKVESPEDQEDFRNENVLILASPDAHGIAMAVASSEYLEKRGAKPTIYSGSALISSEGSTHPAHFFDKTLPNIDVSSYDRLVICDIPLDAYHLQQAEDSIRETTARIDSGRKSRGLAMNNTNIFYLDHHKSSYFSDAWWYDKPEESEGYKSSNSEPIPKDIESYGIKLKITKRAGNCHLGSEASFISRIGAITDRDVSAMPMSWEEEDIANGLEVASRPDFNDPKPQKPQEDGSGTDQETYAEELSKWQQRQQERFQKAIYELKQHNWAYFVKESKRLLSIDTPMSTGFGEVAVIDTSGIDCRLSIPKLMEIALENQAERDQGPEDCPYAIAVTYNLDEPIIRKKVDSITIIRHWIRGDCPAPMDLIASRLDPKLLEKCQIIDQDDLVKIYLENNPEETSLVASKLIEVLSGQEMPDFRGIRTIMICGDPNSGKSVFSTLFAGALRHLGVKTSLLDLDKAAPTPDWYLQAERDYRKALDNFDAKKITEAQFENAKTAYQDAVEDRRQMKRPWTIDLAEESLNDVQTELDKSDVQIVIGDCPGGKPIKDDDGNTIAVSRLSDINAKILEGADAVFIVSNNLDGADEWEQLISDGYDPETGVRINRIKPIRIIGKYHSTLDSQGQKVQKTGQSHSSGSITNLDRQASDNIYNPSVFTTALFVSKAVKGKNEERPLE